MPSTSPRIYRSHLPSVPVVRHSVFSHFLGKGHSADRFSPCSLLFVDASDPQNPSLTRGGLRSLALSLAWALRNVVTTHSDGGFAHLSRGDIVLVFSENSLSWPIMLHGTVAAGLRLSFASSSLKARELAWQWTDCKPRVVFVSPALLSTVREMFRSLGIGDEEAHQRIWVMDRLWDPSHNESVSGQGFQHLGSVIQREKAIEQEVLFDGPLAEEMVFICYSSGTTGRPKGVEISHRNFNTTLEIMRAHARSAETDHDVDLNILPFYHVFGLFAFNCRILSNRPVILLTKGFDPVSFCQAVEKFKVTNILLVPPILLVLSLHPAVAKYDLSSLKIVGSGAAPLSPALATNLLSRLKRQGSNPNLVQGFGTTETTSAILLLDPEQAVRKFGSVGRLAPNMEARLIEENESGEVIDVDEGQPGELWIRGPSIIKGYFNNPDATKASFTKDGFYKTGDILRMDEDGYFYLVDRKKELIKYKGFQVAPAELEAILLENEAVADVGVIGITDQYSGNELPRAYVVPRDRAILKDPSRSESFERTIQQWIVGKVANYKELRGGVVVVESIPKSPTGKILRQELRQRLALEEREKGGPARSNL